MVSTILGQKHQAQETKHLPTRAYPKDGGMALPRSQEVTSKMLQMRRRAHVVSRGKLQQV